MIKTIFQLQAEFSAALQALTGATYPETVGVTPVALAERSKDLSGRRRKIGGPHLSIFIVKGDEGRVKRAEADIRALVEKYYGPVTRVTYPRWTKGGRMCRDIRFFFAPGVYTEA